MLTFKSLRLSPLKPDVFTAFTGFQMWSIS